jgi:hypothetical protein
MDTNEASLAETLRLCEQTLARIQARRPAEPGGYDGLLERVRKIQYEALAELVRIHERGRASARRPP